MIVETVQLGNATIRVHDDAYIGKTKEEMQACIDACYRIELQAMIRKDKTA